MQTRLLVTFGALLSFTACSSGEKANDKDDAKSDGGSSSSGRNNQSGNSSNQGGSGNNTAQGGSSSGTPGGSFGGAIHMGPMFAGADCPSDLGLPDAFALPNVQGRIEGANVRISFDPQGDAKDYRVYALPAKSDVMGTTIKNATYRCAGRTEVPYPAIDDSTTPDNPAVRTRVNSMVENFARTNDDATLGYVYTTPGDGRVPVYALGDPNRKGDNAECYYMRWHETRVKVYTTSEAERTDLLSKSWRDDGIAFYVPAPGRDGTKPVYLVQTKPDDFQKTFYVTDGAEHDKRAADGFKPTEAFSVLNEAGDGTEPLMRVFYQLTCGRAHDELVPGLARFKRALEQGDQPVTELHWSGLTEETTLVVEALDDACPFQGTLAPMSRPSRNNDKIGDMILEYAKFQLPDELRATSPDGELFLNGQGDGTAPKAIARACLKVKPEEPPKMDFFYDGTPEQFSEATPRNFQIWELESPTFNMQFHSVATDEWSVGAMFGEQWVTYADWSSDTNGKMRMTPKQRATLSADKFIHATMEVDVISSQRRYPQMLISDVEWPVQDNLESGGTMITQLFGGVSEAMQVQLQFCDHRTWDVNNQCPKYNVDTLGEGDQQTLMPRPEINQFFGVDRTVRFDVYASSQRMYVYTNGLPYGCAVLPPGKIKEGPVTVTFGDVLYHSSVDLEKWYPFHMSKMRIWNTRHFSNLGFSSNVDAPAWDESRLPCPTEPIAK